MAKPQIFFNFYAEAIINFCKVDNQKKYDKQTKQQTLALRFDCALYFTNETMKNRIAPKIIEAKKIHKNLTVAIKKINDIKRNDKNQDTYDKLTPTYTYESSGKAWVDGLKVENVYQKEIPLDEIKSGDKVLVSGYFIKSHYEGTDYLPLYFTKITKIESEVIKLRENDKDYYDACKAYQTSDVNNGDPETTEEVGMDVTKEFETISTTDTPPWT